MKYWNRQIHRDQYYSSCWGLGGVGRVGSQCLKSLEFPSEMAAEAGKRDRGVGGTVIEMYLMSLKIVNLKPRKQKQPPPSPTKPLAVKEQT